MVELGTEISLIAVIWSLITIIWVNEGQAGGIDKVKSLVVLMLILMVVVIQELVRNCYVMSLVWGPWRSI